MNKTKFKNASNLLQLGIKDYPHRYDKRFIVNGIFADRKLLETLIECVKTNNQVYRNTFREAFYDLEEILESMEYFNIINTDTTEENPTIDIVRRYANLEVINTVMLDDDCLFLTNNMAIRLIENKDNELWLYESELLELYHSYGG